MTANPPARMPWPASGAPRSPSRFRTACPLPTRQPPSWKVPLPIVSRQPPDGPAALRPALCFPPRQPPGAVSVPPSLSASLPAPPGVSSRPPPVPAGHGFCRMPGPGRLPPVLQSTGPCQAPHRRNPPPAVGPESAPTGPVFRPAGLWPCSAAAAHPGSSPPVPSGSGQPSSVSCPAPSSDGRPHRPHGSPFPAFVPEISHLTISRPSDSEAFL